MAVNQAEIQRLSEETCKLQIGGEDLSFFNSLQDFPEGGHVVFVLAGEAEDPLRLASELLHWTLCIPTLLLEGRCLRLSALELSGSTGGVRVLLELFLQVLDVGFNFGQLLRELLAALLAVIDIHWRLSFATLGLYLAFQHGRIVFGNFCFCLCLPGSFLCLAECCGVTATARSSSSSLLLLCAVAAPSASTSSPLCHPFCAFFGIVETEGVGRFRGTTQEAYMCFGKILMLITLTISAGTLVFATPVHEGDLVSAAHFVVSTASSAVVGTDERSCSRQLRRVDLSTGVGSTNHDTGSTAFFPGVSMPGWLTASRFHCSTRLSTCG